MKLENRTPLEAGRYAISDKEGNDLLLVVIKGTYDSGAHGAPTASKNRNPLRRFIYYQACSTAPKRSH
jgi:hypothetical protein